MKFILFCLFLFGALAQNGPDMIIEIFRHGARGPLFDLDKSWPLNTYGSLTPVGMRQHYILGKVIADKYPNVIGSSYNYSQTYMLTDSNPRCVQSAVSHLFGIYDGKGPALPDNYPPELAIPPFQDPIVDQIADSLSDSEALLHKYIPGIVEIDNSTTDIIFYGGRGDYCPNQDTWKKQNEKDLKIAEAIVVFTETFLEAQKYLNMSLFVPENLIAFCDTLPVDIYQNKTLVNLTDPILIDKLGWACQWLAAHLAGGQEVQVQTAVYYLMEAILGELDNFRQGEAYNTAVFYSGHDYNLFPLLAALEAVTGECLMANFHSSADNGSVTYPSCEYPDFASNIIFELYNQTETPYVQVLYNNEPVLICGNQTSCSYDEFVIYARNITGNMTEESYKQECGAKELFLKSLFSSILAASQSSFVSQITVEMSLIVVLSMAFIALTGMIVVDKKKHDQEMQEIRIRNRVY